MTMKNAIKKSVESNYSEMNKKMKGLIKGYYNADSPREKQNHTETILTVSSRITKEDKLESHVEKFLENLQSLNDLKEKF